EREEGDERRHAGARRAEGDHEARGQDPPDDQEHGADVHATSLAVRAKPAGPPPSVRSVLRYSPGDPPRAEGAMAAAGKHRVRGVIAMTAPAAAAALLATAPAPATGGWQVTAQSTLAGSTPSTATVSGSGTAGRLVIHADSGVHVSVRIRLRCTDAGGS